MGTNTALIRIIFVGILVAAGYVLRPVPGMFGLSSGIASALVAALVAASAILFEIRIQMASLKTLIGAAIGSILGIVGGVLIGFLISYQESAAVNHSTKVFLTLMLVFLMAYVGLMVGAAKGDYLDLSALGVGRVPRRRALAPNTYARRTRCAQPCSSAPETAGALEQLF